MKPLLLNVWPEFSDKAIKFVWLPLPIKYSYGLELDIETVIGSPPIGVIITSIGFSLGVEIYMYWIWGVPDPWPCVPMGGM